MRIVRAAWHEAGHFIASRVLSPDRPAWATIWRTEARGRWEGQSSGHPEGREGSIIALSGAIAELIARDDEPTRLSVFRYLSDSDLAASNWTDLDDAIALVREHWTEVADAATRLVTVAREHGYCGWIEEQTPPEAQNVSHCE
jgi:hypothetical protein